MTVSERGTCCSGDLTYEYAIVRGRWGDVGFAARIEREVASRYAPAGRWAAAVVVLDADADYIDCEAEREGLLGAIAADLEARYIGGTR